MGISLLAYVATFSGQVYICRSYFVTLIQSNYFDKTFTISSEQLPFLRSSFFRTITYSQQLFCQNSYFFRAKLLPSSHFLKIGSFFEQLLFRTATFLEEELFRIRIYTEGLLFRSSYFCTHFGKSQLFRKAIFPITYFFLESYLFRVATFSKDATFYSSYLFR